MSDSSDEEGFSDEIEKDKQLVFVQKIKENKIILNKSQIPQIKNEKEATLKVLVKHYQDIFGVSITAKQLAKKISNMKNEVKKKFDINRTGNKPIVYKQWEKLLLQILEVQQNPVFKKIPGAISVGTNEKTEDDNPASSSREIPVSAKHVIPAKKMKIITNIPETDETRNLSNSELQRLVLLEQLKLIRMQQQEIQERKTDNIIHSRVESDTTLDKTYFSL